MFDDAAIRDWAVRLIASETEAESSIREGEFATLRVYEKLRQQLRAPVGVDGFQALASRALSLAKSRSQSLSGLQILANGDISGLTEVPSESRTDRQGAIGVILIAQLLGLLLTLLGEAATVRLLEGGPLRIGPRGELETTSTSSARSSQYLGPFEQISSEAHQLRCVSERLETLADRHTGVDEILGLAGNIRGLASLLDVFTLIRSKAGAREDSILIEPSNGLLN